MMLDPIINPILLIIALVFIALLLVFVLTQKKLRHTKSFRRIAVLFLIVAILAKPSIGGGQVERDLAKLNIYFIVDASGSMATQDIDDNAKRRFEQVSDDIREIIDLYPGSKYGAFVLDYDSYQALPLTTSASTAVSFAKSMRPKNSFRTAGSPLKELLNLANTRIGAYSLNNPGRANLVFFFSDGEDTDNGKTAVPDGFSQIANGGAVIGYGELNPTVEVPEVQDDKISDAIYTRHISPLDEDNLRSIAQGLGVGYYRRTQAQDLFKDRERFITKEIEYDDTENVDGRTELYWLFGLALLAIMLWDFADILSELLAERVKR